MPTPLTSDARPDHHPASEGLAAGHTAAAAQGPAQARLDALRSRLAAVGQSHVLHFAGELAPAELDALVTQLDSLDLEQMPALIERYVRQDAPFEMPTGVRPAPYYAMRGASWDRAGYQARGEGLIRAGKVACFTVAGGQGSRLGYEGPKGCYPTGCVTGKTLFQIFAEKILATGRRYGCVIPWYIMTSPLNHEATVAFFESHGCFGLRRADVMFFEQGVVPSVDKATGRILLNQKHEAATNPDGHGGSYKALVRSGAVADMKRRGVEHVSYFQVDNPNVTVVDPVFLGLHVGADGRDGQASSGQVSSKMLPKVDAKEKVGLFVSATAGGHAGRTMVIEYSDLPDAMANERDGSGGLRYVAGSIAIHAMSVRFIEQVVSDPRYELPYHRAIKKVPYVDLATGRRIEPSEPNAVKMERFVFDAIPLADSSIVLESDRVEEFAPVKNKDGVDSIVTSQRLQTIKAARWLEAAGVRIARDSEGEPDCTIELSPLTATFADDLLRPEVRTKLPAAIGAGARVVL